jgi:hypothetical protein
VAGLALRTRHRSGRAQNTGAFDPAEVTSEALLIVRT